MKKGIILLGFFIFNMVSAQQSKLQNTTVGFEVDVLPYITGGYYGSAWVGHKHIRYRAIVTKVTTPEFYLKDGFINNKIQAYTLIADYFFKPNFEKWWVGAGLEYWNGKIQTDAKISTAKYNNKIFTLGGGYVWKFYKNLYLNPWAAGHLRIAGNSKVFVDSKDYKPPIFTPEISLKVGWHF